MHLIRGKIVSIHHADESIFSLIIQFDKMDACIVQCTLGQIVRTNYMCIIVFFVVFSRPY